MSNTAKHAGRMCTREMLAASSVYVLLVAASAYVIGSVALPKWAAVGIALAPLLPAMAMWRAYTVFTRALDEFQRSMQDKAIRAAAGIVGFGTFAYGFLEEWAEFPHLSPLWVLPAIIAVWGVALGVMRVRDA
jgi:hypothetical protein